MMRCVCRRSVVCLLDRLGHLLGWSPAWLCDRHDRNVLGDE